jgi:hypothetical protein
VAGRASNLEHQIVDLNGAVSLLFSVIQQWQPQPGGRVFAEWQNVQVFFDDYSI